MSKAKMVMTSPEGLRFEWSGGEYIEVKDANAGDSLTLDVINVFDYAEGKPTVTNLFDFSARVRRYMEDNYGEENVVPKDYGIAEMFFTNVKDGSR